MLARKAAHAKASIVRVGKNGSGGCTAAMHLQWQECAARIIYGCDEETPMEYPDPIESPLLDLAEAGSAARPEFLPFLRSFVEECRVDFSTRWTSCVRAARGGSAEAMQLIADRGGELTRAGLAKAARYGHLPLCRWLRQKGVKWPRDIVGRCRAAGAHEVAAWIEQEQAKERRKASSAKQTAAAGAAGSGTVPVFMTLAEALAACGAAPGGMVMVSRGFRIPMPTGNKGLPPIAPAAPPDKSK